MEQPPIAINKITINGHQKKLLITNNIIATNSHK